jgi:hypothetical protein
MKNVTKVFEREDGFAEYAFACRGKSYHIEEWSGTFTTFEDDGEQHIYCEESDTLEEAIAKINYANIPKGPFVGFAPQIPSKKKEEGKK